jgi:RNA-binding protein with serine-rich domain 1
VRSAATPAAGQSAVGPAVGLCTHSRELTSPALRARAPRSQDAKRAAPAPDAPRRVHVGKLTRNVTDAHVKEIFGTWGEVLSAKVAVDESVQLSKGYALVEYASAEAAQDAVDHMDGGQVDGNMVT